MTPQTQERIKADAAKFTDKRYKSTGVSSKEYARHMGVLDGLEEGYIAGATAENERAEAAIDAAIHNERNALQARVTQIDMDWLKRSQVLADDIQMMLDQIEYSPELSWFEIVHKMKGIGLDALRQWKAGKGKEEVVTDEEKYQQWIKENVTVLGEFDFLFANKRIYGKKELRRIYDYLTNPPK